MRREITPGWAYANIGPEGDPVLIDGVDLWKSKWRLAGHSVWLPHPQYAHQIHDYAVYETQGRTGPVRFAAAELSANGWGFYVPKKP